MGPSKSLDCGELHSGSKRNNFTSLLGTVTIRFFFLFLPSAVKVWNLKPYPTFFQFFTLALSRQVMPFFAKQL